MEHWCGTQQHVNMLKQRSCPHPSRCAQFKQQIIPISVSHSGIRVSQQNATGSYTAESGITRACRSDSDVISVHNPSCETSLYAYIPSHDCTSMYACTSLYTRVRLCTSVRLCSLSYYASVRVCWARAGVKCVRFIEYLVCLHCPTDQHYAVD